MITERQIVLIKNSWKLFRGVDPVTIGDVFYSKLFLDAPEVVHLFKTPREEQSKKLIDMLSVIVSRLDRLDELTPEVEQLAIRHVHYGAKPEHYRLIGTALLWTLEKGLGVDWNEELKKAWSACFQILSSTMIRAATRYTAHSRQN
jgi:hemoglobin-like flavoprotein